MGVALYIQLLRFDGYYTMAAIMGVQDPLALVKAFLHDLCPCRRHRAERLPLLAVAAGAHMRCM
jgi:hypothetical protein